MTRAIVIIARNEKDWPRATIADFHANCPGVPVIAVDDGGDNDLTGADYIVEGNLAGVGKARRMGVEKAAELGAETVLLSDAHVFWKEGDIEKAWHLAQTRIVNPTYESYQTGEIKGCGRLHNIGPYAHTHCSVDEGVEVSMYGSVYFMDVETALDIVAPTPSHGCNEQIMTCAAWALGYCIYAFPSLIFRHVYKKQLNYRISAGNQKRNRKLLRWWFFDWQPPENATAEEMGYKARIDENRVLTPEQLEQKITMVNQELKDGR